MALCLQESHAQESFEYLLAKFNTKATAAKQAAAADSAHEAATAEARTAADCTAAAAAAAAQLSSLPIPVSLPFATQRPSSAAPAGSAASTAEQLQLPCAQSSYMMYPPVAQHLGLGAYPMPHMALQALGGMSSMQPAAGSPAAQYMTADMHAAASLMSCGYLPHSAAMLLHGGGGTPTADCLSLMQPSLLFGSPAAVGGLQHAAAALLPQLPAGSAGAISSSSQQDRTPKKRKHSASAAGSRAGTPAKAKAATVPQPTVSSDKAAVAGDQACDQEQGALPKPRKVLQL